MTDEITKESVQAMLHSENPPCWDDESDLHANTIPIAQAYVKQCEVIAERDKFIKDMTTTYETLISERLERSIKLGEVIEELADCLKIYSWNQDDATLELLIRTETALKAAGVEW